MIRRVSEWVVSTQLVDIPPHIRALGKVQFLDSMAAICAGSRSDIGAKLYSATARNASNGPCTVLPYGHKWPLFDAIYLHAALINSLEMDNFSIGGHFSQSAVSTGIALGEVLDAPFSAILRAQILASEVAARLGAFMTTSPQQGHMRAFVHRIGAAVCAGCLLGLDAARMSKAISIALSMPEFPLYPAAFSPETKVISTSDPSVAGCRAAFLAAEGVDATEDILEHPVGFWAYFSYMKEAPDLWQRVGETWTMSALSVKDQASCAYSQGPVVAALKALDGSPLSGQDIKSVVVHAPLVSTVMEGFSHPHLGADITPVNTQFSTKRSVAAALLHGPLDGGFYAAGNFAQRKSAILALSQRVTLAHDWGLTIRMARGIDAGLHNGGMPGLLGSGSASQTLKVMKKAFGGQKLLSFSDLPALFREPAADRNYFLRRYWRGLRPKLPFLTVAAWEAYRSRESEIGDMRFHLSGRVEVALHDGRLLIGEQDVPPGFAGDPNKLVVAEAKFYREVVPVLGADAAAMIFEKVNGPKDWPVRGFFDGIGTV